MPVELRRLRAGLPERAPNGIRTRAAALKGRCPGPLDDGGLRPPEEAREPGNSLFMGYIQAHQGQYIVPAVRGLTRGFDPYRDPHRTRP
jgi:hypothetical protein